MSKGVPKFTREEIKEAIRVELTEADFMGKDNDRYYTTVGMVMSGLDKIELLQTDE